MIDKNRKTAQDELRNTSEELEDRIRERTQAVTLLNQELQELNRRYKEAEERGKFGHWRRDYDDDSVIWSDGCQRIFGIPTEDANNFDKFLASVHKDDRDYLRKQVADTLDTQTTLDVTYRIVRPDGSMRTIHSIAEPSKNHPDQIGTMTGIMIDITELHESERIAQTYQAAVEASSDLIMVVDRDYRYVIANQMYLDYHQYKREDLLSRHISEIVGQDYYENIVKSRLDKCIQGQIQNFEHTMDYPVRGERDLLINYSPLRNDDDFIIGVVIAIRDVTAVKVANISLQKSLDRVNELNQQLEENTVLFQSILRTAHDAIVSIDEGEKIIIFNDGAERLFGYETDEIIGQSLDILLPSEFRANHTHHIAEFTTAKSNHRRMAGDRTELMALHKDGSQVAIEVSISRSKVKNQWIFTSFVRDVSQRKQMEQSLYEAKEAAEAANHAKSIFLANMSHELRTPLNAIIGFTQLMDNDRTFAPHHADQIKIIKNSGEHLLELINEVLELSRIEAGQTNLNNESFDLIQLLETVYPMMQVRAEAKDLYCIFEYDQNLPHYILADPRKLRQILINLLGNAIKFYQ